MVAVNFTRKKVGSLTLGEKLRKIRDDRRITLVEVSKATKIQMKYLEALESGSYETLPPEVYVRGFLRGYAGFLGVPEDAMLKMYDRERSIQKNLGRGEPFRFQPRTPLRFHVDFSSKTAVIALISIVSLGFFTYLSFELSSFVSEPRLVISDPIDGSTIRASELLVSGETDRRASVKINGEDAVVDDDGRFAERVTLTPGRNAIVVSSSNRFGKERTRTVSVNADIPEQPLVSAVSGQAVAPAGLSVSIRMAESANVSVKVDGSVVFSGKLLPDERKEFEAKEEVILSSGVGSAVLVRVGDAAEEPLSEEAASVERVFRVSPEINQ